MILVEMAARNNSDWRYQFRLNNVDLTSGIKTPRDLTGCSVRMDWKADAAAGPTDPIVKTWGGGFNSFLAPAVDPTTGVIVLYVPAVEAVTWPPGKYVGDMLVYAPDNSVSNPLAATFVVSQGITPPVP